MNKYLVIILIALGLVSCQFKKDEQYYRSHPSELQKALKLCPNKQPDELNCQQLEEIGRRMNNLAYQLQRSPQEFGNKILDLQQVIAKQQMEIAKKNTNTELQDSLEKNQEELAYYLAVVKWLESPES
ncbi:hypothetical protein EP47_05195 [Legionella norrlandica]|uniref:Secreted endonuclease n=1 Tax=Legionella norrlandica TaxID=1498499 RepID=A0A0A2STY9_9GAMM|nr:EexN family lipoprotein [Legionella norrlandica]KGP62864.1 hypothetical protein EP47_05195 [Legionella norrlandica]